MKTVRTALVAMILVAAGAGCTKKTPAPGPHEIQGTVQLDMRIQAEHGIQPSAVLYVIARKEAGQPPLAVAAYPQPLKFPLDFKLTRENLMIPNSPFEGKVTLTARIAQSGSATPARAGDVEGTSQPAEVEIGAPGKVTIELNQIRK